ncbi:astakine-like [Oratosquilla oratoria]|uniref:astakine-like n=1 Tax=Oratosquilla oratoria TaxID=337810 RepID=UPI003F77165B
MVPSNFLLVVTVVFLAGAAMDVSSFSGICQDNEGCGPSHCCLVAFGRYTSPTCAPLGEVGSYCRPNKSRQFELGYPNGHVLKVKRGYHGMCPCRPGLVCCRATAMCSLPDRCDIGGFSNQIEE